MLNYMMLAEAAHPWALVALFVILGIFGLVVLAHTRWYEEKNTESSHYEMYEGLLFICVMMIVLPFLFMMPEGPLQTICLEKILLNIAVVAGVLIWLFMHFGLRNMHKWFPERRRKQRQGRPSPPGKGRRSKKGRK